MTTTANQTRATGNPFLDGVWTPMRDELDVTDLPVSGTIPAELSGMYLRIGPNPVLPDPAHYNPFTADGMVHALALSGGQALWCRNRWIRSDRVLRLRGAELTHDPAQHRGTVNTSVKAVGQGLYALMEGGSCPVSLTPELAEQTYDPFGDTLTGSYSAHPRIDPLTREAHAVCYDVRRPGLVTHVVVGANGRVLREEPIQVLGAPMIHDCGLTARYVVVLDLPVTLSNENGSDFPFRWDPNQGARVGLLPRGGRGAEVIWCSLPPAFVFHVANAYDDADGRVVLDCVAYGAMFSDDPSTQDRMRGLERWLIDPATRSVRTSTLDCSPQEFPQIDDRVAGLPHRHLWSVANPADDALSGFGTKLYHHDLVQRTRTVHDFGIGRFPGEFVFVPRHPDSDEGDGWLMGLVINEIQDTSDFVILNAREVGAKAEAVVHLPHRIPPGFHGTWQITSL